MIAGERSSIWRSATLWTWASTGARVLAIRSTLPAVATAFPDTEAVLWYLFLTIASLLLVAVMSFSSVFGRFVAYAVGGAQSLGDQKIPESAATSRGPNVALLHAIYATSHPVYAFVVAAWIIGAGAFGAWSAGDLIREAQQPAAAAIALGAFVAATGVRALLEPLYGHLVRPVRILHLATIRGIRLAHGNSAWCRLRTAWLRIAGADRRLLRLRCGKLCHVPGARIAFSATAGGHRRCSIGRSRRVAGGAPAGMARWNRCAAARWHHARADRERRAARARGDRRQLPPRI